MATARASHQRLTLDGPWACPRCRAEVPSVAPGASIPRCARDGVAFVPASAAAGPPDPLLGAVVGGRFVVFARLGFGSMGTVYRARQEGMGRDVAIKILRSERAFDALAKARFAREAKALSLLRSPNTVTVYDFGEIPEPSGETSLYLAMELLEGESLGQRLRRVGRLPPAVAADVAVQALRSLEEAHEKGVVHRDLKPDNLFLTTSPTGALVCKVLDFGIAKIAGDGAPVDALETQAGTVFGTPRYMSPEQAQGKPLDARSDLYTLGVLLFQMLAGRAPFVDDDAVVVMARHIKTVPPRVDAVAPDAGVPRAVADVVEAALAKDPDARPRSAREFADRLGAAMATADATPAAASGEVSGLVHDDLATAPSARRTRRRVTWALAAGLSAALAAGLWLRATPGAPAEARSVGSLLRARARLIVQEAQPRDPPRPPPVAPPEAPPPPATVAASVASGLPAESVRPLPPKPRPAGQKGRPSGYTMLE